MRKIIFAAAFALLSSCAVYGADNGLLTEKEVVDSAIANNPAIAAADKTARSYEAQSHKSFFLKNPMVGIDVMNIDGNTLNLADPAQKFLMITQEIPFPLKNFWLSGADISRANAFKYAYEMEKNEVVDAARGSFYRLYKTIKYIEITKETAGILKQAAGVAFVKYNNGQAPQQDVLKADLERDRINNDLEILNRQKDGEIQELKNATGDDNIVKDDNFTIEQPQAVELNYSFDEIKNMVLNNAPYLKEAKAVKDSSEAERNAAIAEYIPDLSVEFKKSIIPGSQNYELMIQAELPLFFLNNQQADIGGKFEKAEAKDNLLKEAINKATYEARNDFDIIKGDFSSIELYKNKLIPQASAAFDSAMTEYQAGKIRFIDLLDSERTLLELKKEYYMRLAEYLINFSMLEELAGKPLGDR